MLHRPNSKFGGIASNVLETHDKCSPCEETSATNQDASQSSGCYFGVVQRLYRVLERGETANVRREKLISLAVALNLDLHETDELLACFDRTKLTLDDTPIFLETSRRMKISSALLPLWNAFMVELLFLALGGWLTMPILGDCYLGNRITALQF